MDKTIENDTELEELEEQNLPEDDDPLELVEDQYVKELIAKKIKSLQVQRLKAKEKLSNVLKELESLKSQSSKENNKENNKVVENNNSGGDLSEWKEKIEFLVKRRDFDVDELEIVLAFAKGLNKSLEEAAQHPAVEGALKALRDKKAVERASTTSSRQSQSDESLLSKARSGKLSDKEFKENFEKIKEEYFKSQGSKSFE